MLGERGDEVESFEERATDVLLAKREALAKLTSLGACDVERAACSHQRANPSG